MLIIGIDPGISGAICFFENGKILNVIEMPTMNEGKKNKRQVNGAQIYNEIFKRIDEPQYHNRTPFSIVKLSAWSTEDEMEDLKVSLTYDGLVKSDEPD